MLTPRFIFSDDFIKFYDYFLSQPHTERTFKKGEYLWAPNNGFKRIHYFISGSAIHYADHENGRRKIISFHGPGTVFPGYHQKDFKIELSLVTEALSDIKALEFTMPQFKVMFESNTELAECVIDWYSTYINRFLFESIHQEYNSSFIKVCNLLYLLSSEKAAGSEAVEMTQERLAEILGLSRTQMTRVLSKLREMGIISTGWGKISVTDFPRLSGFCTSETL